MREFALQFVSNSWVVIANTDEELPKDLVSEIFTKISNNNNLGMIYVPYQYYFLKKPINYTYWGKITTNIARVFHKERVQIINMVHTSMKLKDGFSSTIIEKKNNNQVKRFWANSYTQLFEKHWRRYIKIEGEAQYSSGNRFIPGQVMKMIIRTLFDNLFKYEED